MWFKFNLIQFEYNQFVSNWVKVDPIQPISMGTISVFDPKKKNIMFKWIDFNLEIWIESKLNLIWNQFNSIQFNMDFIQYKNLYYFNYYYVSNRKTKKNTGAGHFH
jgi:hypothetical protein